MFIKMKLNIMNHIF